MNYKESFKYVECCQFKGGLVSASITYWGYKMLDNCRNNYSLFQFNMLQVDAGS